jgi:hypothetical protein
MTFSELAPFVAAAIRDPVVEQLIKELRETKEQLADTQSKSNIVTFSYADALVATGILFPVGTTQRSQKILVRDSGSGKEWDAVVRGCELQFSYGLSDRFRAAFGGGPQHRHCYDPELFEIKVDDVEREIGQVGGPDTYSASVLIEGDGTTSGEDIWLGEQIQVPTDAANQLNQCIMGLGFDGCGLTPGFAPYANNLFLMYKRGFCEQDSEELMDSIRGVLIMVDVEER